MDISSRTQTYNVPTPELMEVYSYTRNPPQYPDQSSRTACV
ncbi:uncharacterized protein RCO7_14682 [Rhynchosporium graminicola]|uniref:Uncharacterized protein n=2 Tax=Rhynchosporium TaxID=38037 RepID=A0A1E1MVE9_RHYSE|nr:uncharacterized protein RCO7_14682 [Rhynchosporium commune]CZT53048.1 uncharacterized protein RSE6_14482 [Rhynchosporium secalis]